jgi:hypothetical protein
MPKQFLNYTDLTFNEIISQVNDRLREDPEKRFDSFLESTVAQTMIDIFAASTDMTNYYIERRAEEQFLDTARLKSSVIQLSKILGYVVQRPVPGQSSVKIILKGPLPTSVLEGHTVKFKAFETAFAVGDKKFVLKKDYQYKFTAADIAGGTANSFRKEISVSVPSGTELYLNEAGLVPTSATSPIEIMQGEVKTKTIFGSSNTQVGNIFQKYLIDDVTFSNVFGSEDLNYDDTTNSVSNLADGLTKIAITPASTPITAAFIDESSLYEIDRRTILTSETVIDQNSVLNNLPNVCSIRTTDSQGVEILFGDNKIASKGVAGSNQNLYIQYFSTKGLEGNETGIISKKLTTSNSFETSNGDSITQNIEWQFNSSIIAGADMESNDSIKLNAPGLFYSLDRLITSKDYITFLKSLTSPVNIKNALAWGEQEELEKDPTRTAIPALLNVIFYSCVGPLYNIGESKTTHTHKDLLSNTASDDDKISTFIEGVQYDLGGNTFVEQNYFDIFIKNNMVDYLQNIETSTAPGVNIVNNKIRKRSQITVRNAYVSPLLQQFNLTGDVFIKNLVSVNEIERKVNNAIYEFLDEKSDFAQPLYLSNIIELIESFPEVINTTPTFTPVAGTGTPLVSALELDQDIKNYDAPVKQIIVPQFADSFENFLSTYGYDSTENFNRTLMKSGPNALYDIKVWDDQNYLNNPPYGTNSTGVPNTELKGHIRVANISERNFYEKFVKHFYKAIQGTAAETFGNSNDFKSLFSRANQEMKYMIRSSMKDQSGNIVNYSFQHEIAQVISNLNFKYL